MVTSAIPHDGGFGIPWWDLPPGLLVRFCKFTYTWEFGFCDNSMEAVWFTAHVGPALWEGQQRLRAGLLQ